MRNIKWVLVAAVVSFVVCDLAAAADGDRQETIKAKFVRLTEQKVGEQVYLAIVVRAPEGERQATLIVPKRNERVNVLAKKLKAGQMIVVRVVREADQNWVTAMEVVRVGEGDKPAVERKKEGDRPATKRKVKGDKPAVERKKEGDRPAAERKVKGDKPAVERKKEGDRPAAEQKVKGDKPAVERSAAEREMKVMIERLRNQVKELQNQVKGLQTQNQRLRRLLAAAGIRVEAPRAEADKPRDGERRIEGDRPRDGEERERRGDGEHRDEGDRPRDGDRRVEGDRPRDGDRRDRPAEGDRVER